MAGRSVFSLRFALILGGALALSGCDGVELPGFLARGADKTTATAASTRSVERDVEAPEVFQVADRGLWDGRPSLGGVWVAHPQVRDPERVIIRNTTNGQFVIGVVYRPERSAPGPKFQVSSDAADALGMLAGQPAELSVTALRHEAAPTPAAEPAQMGDSAAAPAVASAALDPVEAATQALDATQSGPSVSAAAITPPSSASSTAAPTAPPAAPVSALDRPFVQIGIFSVQSNAASTADRLRGAGMVPTIKEGKMSGKGFWRVVVGPAATAAERATLLKKIKGLGFNDAYPVSN